MRWKITLFLLLASIFVACGGTNTPSPITINVLGTVKDIGGNPLPGVGVLINGANLQTTGADGTFSYNGVTTPYSLTLKTSGLVMEYRGLSLAKPDLLGAFLSGVNTAKFSGQITGPSFPLPAGEKIYISSTNETFNFGTSSAGNTGSYSSSLFWRGASSKIANLVALRVKTSSGNVTDYLTVGKRTGVSFSNGGNLSGMDINLGATPVPSTNTVFNFSSGAYSTDISAGLIGVTVEGAHFLLTAGPFSSGTSVKIPSEGAMLYVSGKDADGNAAAVVAPANTSGPSSISLPPSAVLKNTAPANAATNVDPRPTLSWVAVPGTTFYLVQLTGPSPANLDLRFIVPASAGTSLTLPDYSLLGIALAANTQYSWNVVAVKTSFYSSVDDLPFPEPQYLLILPAYAGYDLNHFSSGKTTFTTRP